MPVCADCGHIADNKHDTQFGETVSGEAPFCRKCKSKNVYMIETPYAWKLIVQELNSIGISVKQQVKPFGSAGGETKAEPDSGDDDSECTVLSDMEDFDDYLR